MRISHNQQIVITYMNLTYSIKLNINTQILSLPERLAQAGNTVSGTGPLSIQHITHRVRAILHSRWPDLAIRGILAFLFMYGGGLKLMDPKAFAATISHYDLIPEVLLPVVAIGLPALEVAAGTALLFNVRGGLTMITGLLALFVAVLGYGILSDLNVDCGCFGPEEIAGQQSLRQAFVRDLLLIGAASFLYYTRRARAKLEIDRLE
jgi:uncharacterized membrane protein YphA (DoxX/SURF4 family)